MSERKDIAGLPGPSSAIVVRCPACFDVLRRGEHALYCRDCGAYYPVTDDILRLDHSMGYNSCGNPEHSVEPPNSTQETDDQSWYNRFYSKRLSTDFIVSPAVIERYSKLPHPDLFELEKWHELIGEVRGKRLLYIACGIETSAVLFAKRGAEVWAFDLAFQALRFQKKLAMANGTDGRTYFVTGACARLPFCTASFDIVIGIGIWHHLQKDLETPCLELARILKENGFAVFQEPIARSSGLARIRKCIPVPIPSDASPHWCRPLHSNALNVFSRYFKVEAYYFRLFTSLDRLFANTPLEFAHRWLKWASYTLRFIDYSLLRVLGIDRFARSVVFKLTKATASHLILDQMA